MPKVEKLPSGKTIFRWFDDNTGQLRCETHTHAYATGYTSIGFRMRFENGRKIAEMYFGGGVRHRQDYEELRQKYPDMPPADPSVIDDNIEGQAKEERRKRAWAEAATQLGLDPSKLTEGELFCAMIMQKGRRANAVEWVQAPDHTLGEMDQSASRRLVARLMKLGAIAIHACEIDSYEDGRENTGHIVVELPADSAFRAQLFKQIGRIARKTGYRGDPDVRQRFVYVKLD